jgi:tRNA threonylcarbamoyladenosine biosynthesis protein TsaB
MKILAFDTSLGACTAGLWTEGRVIAHDSKMMTQGHAETLMPMIERMMDTAKLTYADLDRIAVTVGPGSFTGLRVGIATARGLAMAAQKPAIGITTTEALAAGVKGAETHILSVIDSKRGDVFAQVFDHAGHAQTEIVNIPDAELSALCGVAPIVVVGDARARAIAVLGAQARTSSAPDICDIAALAAMAATRTPDPHGPAPVYVRAPDVTLSPTGGLLRPSST